MPVSRYVTLRALKHSGSEFPVGTPMALSEDYATPLLAIGAIQGQAGPLPTMPTVPGDVVRETVDTGSGAKARTYVEATSSGGPALYRRPIISRCFASSYQLADNSVNNQTRAQAIALTEKFDSVQIGYVHLGGSGGISGMKALVAATDNIGDMTLTNTLDGKRFVVPWRGGVEKNTVAADGWQSVTWGGAASPTIPDPGAGNTTIAWTDVIPVDAIEDATHPGTYPLLVRLYPGTGYYTYCSQAGFATASKYLAEAGNSYVLGANRSGGDFVTTPSGWGSGMTPSFGDTTILPLIVIGYVGKRRKSVMLIGDSRFASAAPSETAGNAYRNTAFRLEQALATKKATVVSCCMGGQTVGTYQSRALQYMQQCSTDFAVYLVNSINDGSPTALVTANARAKCLAFLDRCAQIGVQPILVTQFPTTGGYGSNYVNALALEDWVTGLGLPYISPLKIYGLEGGDWAAGWNGDANHMTPEGYQDLANRIAAVVSAMI